jgi:ABC-type phosphate transport system substrate-binding protein
MRPGKSIPCFFSLLTLLFCSSMLLAPDSGAQAHDPMVMVVNKANATADVGKPEAKKLLLGTTGSWTDGKKVVVVLRPQGTPDRAELLKDICGMSEAEFTRYEMQAMFTGRVPVKTQEEPSSAAIKAFVKANPGALGFIHESEVDKDVKNVMTVQ